MKTVISGVAAATTAALLQLSAPTANAVVVQYCGPNLCYEYDDAQAAVTYYGQPGFAGDDAYFLPNIFEARSADGVGLHTLTNTDFVDSTWVFSRVWTLNSANEIASIYAYEEGDYLINYADGTVAGDLYLRAYGLNLPLEPTVVGTDSVAFAGVSGGVQDWNMTASISPAVSLTQMANNITLTIQNQLSAFTDNTTPGSELAWIEKKLILEINTIIPVAQIPVPAAVWLLGSAFGVLTLVRRRAA